MLRIVEIHPATTARGEYIVLQNLGLVTVNLRGWALCNDGYLSNDPDQIGSSMYVFRDDVAIKPYTRVVLFTGEGENGWLPTTDGKQAYCVFWGRGERLWAASPNVHVLQMLASRPIKPEALPTVAAHA